MDNKVKHICTIFFCFIFSISFVSCHSSSPEVKPPKENEFKTGKEKKPEVENITSYNNSLKKPNTEYNEIWLKSSTLKQYFRGLNHIAMIEIACGYYHDAFGIMPDSPYELLDGFMLFWPKNIYENCPLKVVTEPLNPLNPSDRGNIRYVRTNDHMAKIQFLLLDLKNSTDENLIWELNENNVFSATAKYVSDPSKWRDTPLGTMSEQILGYPKNKRILFSYVKNLEQSISFILDDSLERSGSLDNSFNDVLLNGGYYITKDGFDILKKSVKKGDVILTLGEFDDNIHTFYECSLPNEKKELKCKCYDADSGAYGKIDHNCNCPEGIKRSIIFSSENIDKLNISPTLVISRKDLEK